MPYELPLPTSLKSQRWKIKVWDKELGEDPHVTIICKTRWWRWALRDQEFMDTSPDPSLIPKEVLAELTKPENYREMCLAWNRIHPNDPVVVPPEDTAEDEDE